MALGDRPAQRAREEDGEYVKTDERPNNIGKLHLGFDVVCGEKAYTMLKHDGGKWVKGAKSGKLKQVSQSDFERRCRAKFGGYSDKDLIETVAICRNPKNKAHIDALKTAFDDVAAYLEKAPKEDVLALIGV